jgi:hypothetical protein
VGSDGCGGTCSVSGTACSDGYSCSGGGCSYNGESSSSSTSSSGGESVVCTESYRVGFISEEFYEADKEYAKKVTNKEIMTGYYSWGKPLVRAMKKNIFLTFQVAPIAFEWSKHSAYMVGVSDEDSKIGRIILNEALPLSEKLGNELIARGMSNYEFDEKLVKKLVKKYIKNDLDKIDFRSFFKELEENLPK